MAMKRYGIAAGSIPEKIAAGLRTKVGYDTPGGTFKAKAAFVTAHASRFDLLETMKFDGKEGLLLLEEHIARLRASAEKLGFACDRHALRNELQAATFRIQTDSRVRMRLSQSGAVAIEVSVFGH